MVLAAVAILVQHHLEEVDYPGDYVINAFLKKYLQVTLGDRVFYVTNWKNTPIASFVVTVGLEVTFAIGIISVFKEDFGYHVIFTELLIAMVIVGICVLDPIEDWVRVVVDFILVLINFAFNIRLQQNRISARIRDIELQFKNRDLGGHFGYHAV
ncbi:hypothetical protein HDE_05044 [Halotydeus destructor]|nr:hypothetical protein HDE_05044 [Halotydeus destructor]